MDSITTIIDWFINFWNTITTINIASISLYSIIMLAITMLMIKFILRKVDGL